MAAAGIPMEEDQFNPRQVVFSFPVKGPDTGVFRNDMTAIEQLEHWKMMQDHWCEHKPSITVYYRPEEFLKVGQWVWDHFDEVSGVAFLPYDGGSYTQAPYEEITQEAYEEFVTKFPTNVNWESLIEIDDFTTGAQTLACSGAGSCEL